MSTRARPVRPFCGIRLADHRPKFLGWDEILQAFATAAIGRSLRPVHQGERTSVPLLRRLVAPASLARQYAQRTRSSRMRNRCAFALWLLVQTAALTATNRDAVGGYLYLDVQR